MFKDGFILNYYPGAKGDFLLRFLLNLPYQFTNFGKTIPVRDFKKAHYKMREYLGSGYSIQEKSKEITDYILNQAKEHPHSMHDLHELTEQDQQIIMSSYKHTYDLVVEEDFYLEVLINKVFKNYGAKLTQDTLETINNRFDMFNGQYLIDYVQARKTKNFSLDFTDESRIEYLISIFSIDLASNLQKMKDFSNKQIKSNSEKIFYSQTFCSPYEDLKSIYNTFNKKNPDLSKIELFLSKTLVPKELVLFNHKIRINQDSEHIIQVLGKVNP